VQVAIAGGSGPLGGIHDPGDARLVAEIGRVDHLLDPCRAGALDRSAVVIDLAQMRRSELGLAEFDGEFAHREEAAPPVR